MLRPLYDRVIVKRIEPEEVSKGGLWIPPNAQEETNLVKVHEVGNGRLTRDGEIVPLKIEKGMTALIGKYAGDVVNVDDEELLIIREEDILAIVMNE